MPKTKIKLGIIVILLSFLFPQIYTDGDLVAEIATPIKIDETPDSGYYSEYIGNVSGLWYKDMKSYNGLLYCACGGNGLQIINYTDSLHPFIQGSLGGFSDARSIAFSGDLLYLADWDGSMSIINISDSSNPIKIGNYNSPGRFESIVYKDNCVFLANYDDPLEIIDVSNPYSPLNIANYTTGKRGFDVTIQDNNLFVALGSAVTILDISDPSNPTLIKTIEEDISSLLVEDDILYGYGFYGIFIYDVSSISNPVLLSHAYLRGNDGVLDGDMLYLSTTHFYGYYISNVSDPLNIENSDKYTTVGGFPSQTYSIEVDNNLLFVGGLYFLNLYDISPTTPRTPSDLEATPGSGSIELEWTRTFEFPEIQYYNIYRSDTSGGTKTLIDTSSTANFTDATIENASYYYYQITAVNEIGESGYSEEIEGIGGPHLKWVTPMNNIEIIFGSGSAIFNFSYQYFGIEDVTLEIENTDFGSVWGLNSVIINPYNTTFDGEVNATLYGYEEGNPDPILNDSRLFTFTKITSDNHILLDSNTEYLGQMLYLIMHDPNGDKSYSSFAKSTVFSMGTRVESSDTASVGVEIGAKLGLFGKEFGASYKLELEETDQEAYDFRYEVKDSTELTSSQDYTNRDYIGPGCGDRYWGEAWALKWEFTIHDRTYFNGSQKLESPKLEYGIIRGNEVILSDYDAPSEWYYQNPIHNNSQKVSWGGALTVTGGSAYSNIHEITSTETRSQSCTISFTQNLEIITSFVNTEVDLTLSTTNYQEESQSETYVTSYTIYDDDSNDSIVQDWGIDETFGTYIFRTNEFFSKTSSPLEYNTTDYIAPEIGFPEINLDSNFDGTSPCNDDQPVITVSINEEGGVQSAILWFSLNDGVNWDSVYLSEQLGNPGIWKGILPANSHGTEVLWYLNVTDMQGLTSTRKDPDLEYYNYQVQNRLPSLLLNSPLGGEILNDSITIEWSGNDPDSDSLTYQLAYNTGGTGWYLIARDLATTSYEWNISTLPYSDSVQLKVIANDGYGGIVEVQTDFVFTINPILDDNTDNSDNSNPEDTKDKEDLLMTYLSITMISSIAAVALSLTSQMRLGKIAKS